MKKYLLVLFVLISGISSSQVPQAFNYQAQVRDGDGNLITNRNVSFKFNIKQGGPTTYPVYIEEHLTSTDDLGQVDLAIGYGAPRLGLFSEIDWMLGSYYLDVELNIGNGYIPMGTTSFLSVPYALFSETSGDSQVPAIQDVLNVGNNADDQQIKGLATPTEDRDAANKLYVDQQVLDATQNLDQVLQEGNNANGQQIKELLDPTDPQDAVTKSYVDGLSNNQGLMNFNGWDNYQVWNDNTTVQLTPNSFVFVNANNTTLVFPSEPENCCFGDVIYVYFMGDGATEPIPVFNLQASGFPVAVGGGIAPLDWTSDGIISGSFNSAGLKTIVNVGDFWMVADFTGDITTNPNTDEDGDGYTENQGDCNDNDSTIYPGAPEICDDGIDQDCNGIDLSCNDVDNDGDGYTENQGDCNDNDATIYPGATEVIGDGIDNDCDGNIDFCPIESDFTGTYFLTTLVPGIFDSQVFLNGEVTLTQGNSSVTAREFITKVYPEFGDFIPITFTFDLACNGVVEVPSQATGVGCGSSTFIGLSTQTGIYNSSDDSSFTIIAMDDIESSCGSPVEVQFLLEKIDPNTTDFDNDGFTENEGDCNDNDATIYPGAPEICDDGIDQDCNGSDLSCNDVDNDGDGFTLNDGDCNDNDSSIYPGADEICDDGIDQDCDGSDCTTEPPPPPGGECSGSEIQDDMESYTDGAPIFEAHWTDWCGGSCGDLALMASSAQARSGTLSAFIPGDNTTDPILDLGNKIFGQWGLEFWMYIPAGKTGYFNMQGTVPIGVGEWPVGNIFFNRDGTNPGVGSIDDSALGLVEFNFPHDQWFPVVMNFDLSLGMAAATWQFNINGTDVLPGGTPYTNADGITATSLDGMNFYSLGTNNELYIDDLCYGEGFVEPNDPEPDVDNDGDGYTAAQGDCNDNDATIYPGAEEICNDGIDQDCDGSDCTTEPPPPGGIVITVNDFITQEQIGYANVFETEANGGGFAFGESWGIPDLKTVVDGTNNTITIQPNFNAYGDGTDPFWVDQATTNGNKMFEGNTYVEDNSLVGSELTFTGTVTTNTLAGNGQLLFSVNNGPLEGGHQAIPAQFGGPFTTTALTEDAVLVTDESSEPDENDACEPITNGPDLAGKVAVVRRGACQFGFKALQAQNEGAVAVIVVNNVEGPPIIMAGGADGGSVTIPVLMVSDVVGEAIIAELANGVNTTMVLSDYTTTAIIKVFNSDYSVLKQESVDLGPDGTDFSVTYDNVEEADAIVQYGFQVFGLNANPVNEIRLGSVVLGGDGEPSPDVDNDGDGYTAAQGDCNDNDATIYPGAEEICDDGIDQDCNGSDLSCDDVDNDSDGFTEAQGDCNDNDATIYPGAEEICDDGIDQDCNGSDLLAPTIEPLESQEICEGTPVQLNATAANFDQIQWTTSGDGTFSDTTTLTPIFTPGVQDIINSFIILTIEVSNQCGSVTSELTLNITQNPTVDAGADITICQDGTASLSATATDFASVQWTMTGGNGNLANDTSLNAQYVSTPTDVGPIFLTVTVTPNDANGVPCGSSVSDTTTIFIEASPTVDAGPSIEVCEGPFQITGASASNFEQLQWTTSGDGTFSDANTLTPTYTPGPSDINSGGTFFTLTAENDCGIDSEDLFCDILPSSSFTIQGNDAQILCNGDQLETITYFPSNGGDVSPETLVTGLPLGIEFLNFGSGINIFGTPTVDINVTTSYTYTISNYWGECPGDDVTGTITIQPCDDIDNDGDGFTENQGDCNDNDATIYPGAEEICDDGIDQDCDGIDCESEPCDISNPSNNFETGIVNFGSYIAANDFIISSNFTLMQINLNLFHETAATISTVAITYYEDAGGAPGAEIGTETLVPASQAVVGSNFGYNVSEVILDISPVNFTEGTYWIGATAVSSTGGLTAWETTSASSIGADSVISEDGGNSWGSGRDDGVFILMGSCND